MPTQTRSSCRPPEAPLGAASRSDSVGKFAWLKLWIFLSLGTLVHLRHFSSLKALQTWLPARIYHSGKFTRYAFWRAAMPSYDISKTLKHSESPVAIAFSLVYFIFGFTPSPNPAIHAFNISHIVSNDAPASLQYCS